MALTEHEMKLFKQFYHIVETLKIHGEVTYGSSEINVEALVNYLNHPSFAIQCWGVQNEDDIEQAVIDDIMNGMPVWRFYNLSPWAQEMQEREWAELVAEEEARRAKQLEEDRKIYKCLQDCVYYDYKETSLGTFVRCDIKHVGGDDFKLCKRCSKYINKNNPNAEELKRKQWLGR